MKDHIAVLIPCYNESRTIEKVVHVLSAGCRKQPSMCTTTIPATERVRLPRGAGAVVRRERMQGKGSVIRRMFREIDADCYLMVDGDDTYPAEDAPAMAARRA